MSFPVITPSLGRRDYNTFETGHFCFARTGHYYIAMTEVFCGEVLRPLKRPQDQIKKPTVLPMGFLIWLPIVDELSNWFMSEDYAVFGDAAFRIICHAARNITPCIPMHR
jgi:hypothetical protein